MAPSSNGSNQQVIAQAAEQLAQAVRETGEGPNVFAKALLDLIEVSAKVAEFDDMAAAAREEAKSEEAKQWQEIALLTLTYSRQSLIEQQHKAIREVSALAEKGASLFKNPEKKEEVAAVSAEVDKVAATVPEPASRASPPGVWAVGPPPGLAPPPGLSGPPGLEVCTKAKVQNGKPAGKTSAKVQQQTPPEPSKLPAQLKRTALPPWRKEKAAAKEPEPPAFGLAINLDAYSDGSETD